MRWRKTRPGAYYCWVGQWRCDVYRLAWSKTRWFWRAHKHNYMRSWEWQASGDANSYTTGRMMCELYMDMNPGQRSV